MSNLVHVVLVEFRIIEIFIFKNHIALQCLQEIIQQYSKHCIQRDEILRSKIESVLEFTVVVAFSESDFSDGFAKFTNIKIEENKFEFYLIEN